MHKVTPGLPKLAGDLDRLQQLFINLVDNAIKYTPAGGQVTLAATRSASQNSHDRQVEIAVSDTGPGIPERTYRASPNDFIGSIKRARAISRHGVGIGDR